MCHCIFRYPSHSASSLIKWSIHFLPISGFADIKKSMPSDINCAARNIDGFLKRVCFNESTKQYYHACVTSKVPYQQNSWLKYEADRYIYKLSSVSSQCDNDPGVYQACGFSTRINKCSKYFCGGTFIDDANKQVERFVERAQDCEGDKNDVGAKEQKAKSLSVSDTNVCDDKCDSTLCSDESDCNGVKYGLYCIWWVYRNYVPVSFICAGVDACNNGEDMSNCSVTGNSKSNTCIHYHSKVESNITKTVSILNYTRCTVFDLSSRNTYPYCYDYLDQTNCTDVSRVGGHCLIYGYMSTISKYVTCDSKFKSIDGPANLCDDRLENECISPPGSVDCVVHKHKLCDGVIDCSDCSDEDNDNCRLAKTNSFKCNRTFNFMGNYMHVPSLWILDNQTDCVNGEDEIVGMWKFCDKEEKYRVRPVRESCNAAFLCPGQINHYVEFDLLCDGIDSCESGVENKVCAISRDFPEIN